MTSKKEQNDSDKEGNERKELKHIAMITHFSQGHYTMIFDFKKCREICNKGHQYYNRDKKPRSDFPPKSYILQAARTKINMFETYLKNLKGPEAFFLITSPNHMFMDIQDLFLSIFRRMEGILNLSYKFGKFNFSKRIKELGLPPEMENDLGKLTTLRNKLIHTYGYPKPNPKVEIDYKLNKLINEGIQKISFNSDPSKKLIEENYIENIGILDINLGKWVTLIEILLDIVSYINKTPKTFGKGEK